MKIILSMLLILSIAANAFANSELEGWISTPDGPAKVKYQIKDGVPMIGGDMEVTIYDDPSDIEQKGAGRWWRGRKWPNKTIPYVIHQDMPETLRTRILDAISYYHQNTQIQLVRRTNEKSFVSFQYNGADGSCSSFIGRKCPWCKQIIRIPDWCGTGSVIHEIGHALGMIHEQSRWDRNNHVKIHWNNIEPANKYNFYRIPILFRSYTDFDFDSIMMYGPYAFAVDKTKPTITKPDGSLYEVQRRELSEHDKEAIAKMYGYFQ